MTSYDLVALKNMSREKKEETCSKVKIQHISRKANRQAVQASRQVGTKKSPQFEGLLLGL